MAMIDEIKARYPRPRRPVLPPEGKRRVGYCVGGALCLYVRETQIPDNAVSYVKNDRFPTPSSISYALIVLNPSLGRFDADPYQFACDITRANDEERFADAWRVAAEALAWQPEEPL